MTTTEEIYYGYEAAEESRAREAAEALEAKGVFVWLMALFPFAFEEEFSDDHRDFWEKYWSILLRIREQRKYRKLKLPVPARFEIKQDEWVYLLILGRGLAKSSTIEASSVMRGAILDGGYCVYICEAQDQADEHIGNCRTLIEHEESRLTEFYPHMAIDTNARVNGKKTKDKTDIFMTVGGSRSQSWICRAKGLKAKLRGLRIGNMRPDDICIDDIDGVNDSIEVSLKKLKDLTASVAPIQARWGATIKFGQNLINETGVMTLIHTGKSDAFSERKTVGVTNTFVDFREGIEYKTYFDEEEGRVKHKILAAAVPTWSGVDIPQAQKFLNDSGLETFIAEYQNSFDHLKTGRVFHEFDEKRHIITWDDYQRVFGLRFIPQHWRAKVSADIGFSKESISAWQFTASAAQNTPLPGRYFAYRSLTFAMDSIDDQAVKIWETLFPDFAVGKKHFEAKTSFTDYPELFRLLKTKPECAPYLKTFEQNAENGKVEFKPLAFAADATPEEKALFYVKQAEERFKSQIQMWSISHEKTGEQKTLAQKYGLPCNKVKDYRVDSGVAEANHLLRGDYTKQHPFFPDEKVMDEVTGEWTGLWKLGEPYIFFIVERREAPRDDRDMKTLREHLSTQRWTQEKMTEHGLTRTIPMKYKSDCGDAFRMFAVDYAIPAAAAPSLKEEVEMLIPESVRPQMQEDGTFDMSKAKQHEYMNRLRAAEDKLKQKHGKDVFEDYADEIEEYKSPFDEDDGDDGDYDPEWWDR